MRRALIIESTLCIAMLGMNVASWANIEAPTRVSSDQTVKCLHTTQSSAHHTGAQSAKRSIAGATHGATNQRAGQSRAHRTVARTSSPSSSLNYLVPPPPPYTPSISAESSSNGDTAYQPNDNGQSTQTEKVTRSKKSRNKKHRTDVARVETQGGYVQGRKATKSAHRVFSIARGFKFVWRHLHTHKQSQTT